MIDGANDDLDHWEMKNDGDETFSDCDVFFVWMNEMVVIGSVPSAFWVTLNAVSATLIEVDVENGIVFEAIDCETVVDVVLGCDFCEPVIDGVWVNDYDRKKNAVEAILDDE